MTFLELKRHFGDLFGAIFGAIFGGNLLGGAESALHYSGELHLETYLELKRHFGDLFGGIYLQKATTALESLYYIWRHY